MIRVTQTPQPSGVVLVLQSDERLDKMARDRQDPPYRLQRAPAQLI